MAELSLVREAAPRSVTTYDAVGQFRLVGMHCRDCGDKMFPGFEVCQNCQGERMEPHPLSTVGKLYSWSVVHVVPKPWTAPLVMGYVDLPENVRVFAHIGGDPQALRVDMPVRVEPAVVGVDAEGQPRPFFQFVPA